MDKQEEVVIGWIIDTNVGVIFFSKDGEYYFGGSPSLVAVGLFVDKKEAIQQARRVKRHKLVTWTKVKKVRRYKT